jgi:hypothetical protein
MKPKPLSSLNHFTVPVGIAAFHPMNLCCVSEEAFAAWTRRLHPSPSWFLGLTAGQIST